MSKNKHVIKKGTQDWETIGFLLRQRGQGPDGANLTIEELAAMVPLVRGGHGKKASSFRSEISNIKGALENSGAKDLYKMFVESMPVDMGIGGQGRRAAPVATEDDFAELAAQFAQ